MKNFKFVSIIVHFDCTLGEECTWSYMKTRYIFRYLHILNAHLVLYTSKVLTLIWGNYKKAVFFDTGEKSRRYSYLHG